MEGRQDEFRAWCAPGGAVPVQGETTWSFLHRVAACYGVEVSGLQAWGWWQWVNPIARSSSRRPDGEVLLNAVAQAQVAAWCGTPAIHLAWALPSWMAGPAAFGEQTGEEQAWARWRVGAREWGPVSFGCRLCTARRSGRAQRVWRYGQRWHRVCARHGRWLLDVGDGHDLEYLDVGGCEELAAAQARWPRVARRAMGAGVEAGAVFAVARAVVCGWWEQEAFWQREQVWGQRLERVVLGNSRKPRAEVGRPDAWWRLVARDAVVFPEVMTVAAALMDPALRPLVADGRALVRRAGHEDHFMAALGDRLGRGWLREVEESDGPGALQAWMSGLTRGMRSPSLSGQAHHQMWRVGAPHRPVEVGVGLRLLAAAAPAGERQREEPAVWQSELWVPRRAGRGAGLKAVSEERFLEGLAHARVYAERYGHLAIPHTGSPYNGFDLGRWLASLRAASAGLPPERARLLTKLDAWWNPPWPVSWQRAWHRAHAHTLAHGPVSGGDNLKGLPRWLERWVRCQIGGYRQLAAGQQQLLAQLGLTCAEVDRFHAWPARRRAVTHGLDAARSYTARYGHLAVSQPTTHDGFALGKWLNLHRHRQRVAAQPTRLGLELTALDAWWSPPWQLSWQRSYWAARHHFHGLPDGVVWWPGAPDQAQTRQWLHAQQASWQHLHDGQRELVGALAPALLAAAP
ncbi:helicase associated domain-containing protein [Streptomyces phaeochromogenes]|uniref:helicase associated domain-containing protein n=1 Tax=Streptomyces phaeochromogenes TaxID=1923 RepID=UPI002E2A614A|nr:helicase associated domain-containing protein [Streptomyces phaeochromogenes]